MADDYGTRLSHVMWIGGAPDSGKTTVAKIIARHHGWTLYHYDQADLRHHERLAAQAPSYAAFMKAGMDERWVDTTPDDLAARAWQSFHDRFPFVIEDLLALPSQRPVIAEGFGLTPALVAPLLSRPQHGAWLFPAAKFKRESMARRQKGNFGGLVREPSKATANLLARDEVLAAQLHTDAVSHGFTMFEVDGSETASVLAARLTAYFSSI